MWESRPAVQPTAPEPQPAPEPEPVTPPALELLELVVPTDAVIGLQMESTVSSDVSTEDDARRPFCDTNDCPAEAAQADAR